MKSIEISDSAFNYLQSQAVPLQDTTVSVLDRILEEHQAHSRAVSSHPNATKTPRLDMSFGVDNLPNVSFTTIDAATIDGGIAKKLYWNDILEEMIVRAVAEGADRAKLKSMLSVQTKDGQHYDNGYRFVTEAGFSFQGVDAVRACKGIALLSKTYGISVEMDIRWQSSPKAQFAGQVGRLVLP